MYTLQLFMAEGKEVRVRVQCVMVFCYTQFKMHSVLVDQVLDRSEALSIHRLSHSTVVYSIATGGTPRL